MKQRKKPITIPKGLTEVEVVEAVDYIVARLAPKFVFGCHTLADIEQEGRLLALEALENFDPNWKDTGTLNDKLKSFLYRHVRNRLINFKRDQLGRTIAKQSVTCALSIDNIDDQSEKNMHLDDNIDNMVCVAEAKQLIYKYLPQDLLGDYKKMLADAPVPKARRLKVEEAVKEILSNEFTA